MPEPIGVWSLAVKVDVEGMSAVRGGLQQFESAIGESANRAKTFGANLSGIKDTVSGLGKNLMILGALGAGAIGGLAALAPSLAGNFADLQIAMMGVGEALAPHIAPIIDKIVLGLEGFSAWITENGEPIGKFFDGVEASLDSFLGVLGDFGTWLTENPAALEFLGTTLPALAALGVFSVVANMGINLASGMLSLFSLSGAGGLAYIGPAIVMAATLFVTIEILKGIDEALAESGDAGYYLFGQGKDSRIEYQTAGQRAADVFLFPQENALGLNAEIGRPLNTTDIQQAQINAQRFSAEGITGGVGNIEGMETFNKQKTVIINNYIEGSITAAQDLIEQIMRSLNQQQNQY